ncbi:MAG: ATP-binding protein, partial [Flavobacteriaceae bacterium]
SLELINRNSDNLLHLINEMLDLAKIESGNMELQLEQTDVIPFLKYVSESFSSLAEENQISLTVYSEIDNLIMDFDAKRLTSVISNLLSNAIKFTHKYGKIIVHINKTVKNKNQYLLIKVKDNGIGIAKEKLSNIFNRFYQTDTSTIRKRQGTGIGLALTKELVELMNGTITVKSTPNIGSEFSLMIPITNKAKTSRAIKIDNDVSIPRSNKISLPADTNSETNPELPLVIIIEDNKDVAFYLKSCLKENYRTEHALNGELGIKMALEKIPDVIISDVMMPEKNGFEVCETLKMEELTDHIPIIMLTAKAAFKDRLAGLSYGADAYLTKPFEKAELLTRIEQLILVRKKILSKFEKGNIEQLLHKNVKKSESKFLQKVITNIQDNITKTDFGPIQLADQLFISESQLYRKLKATTDKSTAVFIRSIKLQKGKELLQITNKTISEVAYEVGFNDPSYFSRVFKKEFGQAPSNFIN